MAIDYDRLLHDPLLKERVSKRQYDAYLAGEKELCEDIDACSVFTLSWDGGGMLGSGILSIGEWKRFYFITSTDFDDEGPFHSLEEALDHDYFTRSAPNPELRCDQLTTDQLFSAARYLVVDQNPQRVCINGKDYELIGDHWVTQEEEPS